MAGIGTRIVRAARLEPALYEEVEADRSATRQAFLVVVLASVAGGIGAAGAKGAAGLAFGAIGAALGWVIWAFTILVIGTKILATADTRSDMGEVLRTLGFAASPGLIRVVGIIPGLSVISSVAAALWTLAATVVAVRQALDYTSTGRAIAVCLLGFFANVLIIGLVVGLAGRS